MYTIQENVQIVIALLKEYNIRHIVVSPGGTNIPISQAVQDDPFFHCYSVVDERSAMYFAIGLYLQTGEIIATSCTSAQATRNYIPGLTEAYYKHVPILAITTAKLQRFQYQEYMQAPDQCSMPKDAVKKSFDLPPITDENTRAQCIHDAKEAILELEHRSPGPVQLNIRITDSLQGKFEKVELPIIQKVQRYMAWDNWDDIVLGNKKILIVIGEHRPFSVNEQNAIDDFCEFYNVAVYVTHLSNYYGKFSIQGNLLISTVGLNSLIPDVFITIGGQTGDYAIYGALNNCVKAEHWRIAIDGNFVDTYNRLTKIFECPFDFFFRKIAKNVKSNHEYYDSWKELNNTMNYDIDVPFSNLYTAQQLYKLIPNNSIINYAILNSLRCWNYFPLKSDIQCYANVAAFGIDGCNSMLIGESMNSDSLCFIITGDLAFFYDMNALGIRSIKNNVRILLINNSGGAEFKIMTNSWRTQFNVDTYISACGHNSTAKGWSENCGFKYISASSKEEFNKLKSEFVDKCDKPVILEIFTDGDNEINSIQSILNANIKSEPLDKAKSLVKKIVGDKIINQFKKL